MSKDEIYNMIGKRLAGESGELENRQFEKWLGDDGANKSMYEVIQKSWQVPSEVKAKEQQGQLFDKIVDEIGEEGFHSHGQMKVSSFRYMMRYAAAVALVVMVSVGLWQVYETARSADQVVMVHKTNPKGQKSTIHLPDGSKVVLNAGSTLSYPTSFSGNMREIVLDGEAFFDVMKNPSQPFIVRAQNVSIRALGTAFNVNTNYENVEVALTEGKVEVSLDGAINQKIVLLPGEMASIGKKSKTLTKEIFDAYQVISWTDGKLVFVDASMHEVMEKLERWYGVKIEVKGLHSHSWNYNGEFNNAHLTRVLMSLGFTQGFSYKIEDEKVTLTGKQ